MIEKLKIIIISVILSIIDSIIVPSCAEKKGDILLVRLDGIGDYILFRNFIQILKESEQYRDSKITLVGNQAWKNLAEALDQKFIDSFIWVDRKKFQRNIIYRLKNLREIASTHYKEVINLTFSRSFFIDDAIVKNVTAERKVGSEGDLSHLIKWQKNISDRYYSDLVSVDRKIKFEFYRNREFFESLLIEKIRLSKPTVTLPKIRTNLKFSEKSAILFIGAGDDYRKWGIKKFMSIGKHLKDNFGYDIALCGGPTDSEKAQEFKKICEYDYLDLVGKTTLLEFMHLISRGNIMITNESSAPHFAVALEMEYIFIVSNGNHFGRFTPYPKDIWGNYYPIYHPEIEKSLERYKKISTSYGYGSKLDINEITVEQVVRKINQVLGK